MNKELLEAIEQAWEQHKQDYEGLTTFALLYPSQISQLIKFAKEKIDE